MEREVNILADLPVLVGGGKKHTSVPPRHSAYWFVIRVTDRVDSDVTDQPLSLGLYRCTAVAMPTRPSFPVPISKQSCLHYN